MKEIWRHIEGYEDSYVVSNLGNVRSLDRPIYNGKGWWTKPGEDMKPMVTKKGYLSVALSKDGKDKAIPIHRLVAFAFIPNDNPEIKNQVNHIDGNKQNNVWTNLEWCDNSYNQIHAYAHGLNYASPNAGRKKIPVIQRDKDTLEIIARFSSIAEACKQTGKSQCCVKKGIYKQTKNGISGGYIWDIDTECETNQNNTEANINE